MLAKSLLTFAAWFVLACSAEKKKQDASPAGGTAGAAGAGELGDQRLIVPEGINVTPRPGINSVFNVIAVTVRQGSSGELYAAVRNDGDIVACNASFSVELHDKDDQVIAAGGGGLMARRFYRITSGVGAGTVAGCLAPGDMTMVAVTDLSLDTPLENARSVVYSSSYWGNLAIDAIDGVSLTQVKAVSRSGGVAYTGALINQLDTELSHPTVAVFPVNAAGRPLGVAYGGAMLDLSPGASWAFETNTVSDPGVGYQAFPMGGP